MDDWKKKPFGYGRTRLGDFSKNKRTFSEHIGNLFQKGELDKSSTVRKFRKVHSSKTNTPSLRCNTYPRGWFYQFTLVLKHFPRVELPLHVTLKAIPVGIIGVPAG